MYLLGDYGFISDVKVTYSLDELNSVFKYYVDSRVNIYFLGIYINNIDFLDYLYQIGYDIYTKDNFIGTNAYLIAAFYGKISIMKYLENLEKRLNFIFINQRFSIYHKNNLKHNAYLEAVSSGKINVVKYLIKQKNAGKIWFDINQVDLHNRCPFIIAAENGKIKMLKFLASIGVKTNNIDSNGLNAHICAIYKARIKTAEYLYKNYNYNIHLTDKDGFNIYTFIIKFGIIRSSVMKYLEIMNLDFYVHVQNEKPDFISFVKDNVSEFDTFNYFIKNEQRRLIFLDNFKYQLWHKKYIYLKYKLEKYNFYWRFIILFI